MSGPDDVLGGTDDAGGGPPAPEVARPGGSQNDIHEQLWNIDFGVSKSLRYHAYRRSFWEAWAYASKLLTIISGTAVLVTLVGDKTTAATILSIIVAITSAADVVFGFDTKSRRHDSLYRMFSALAQKIADLHEPTPGDIAGLRRQRLEIEMEEPGTIDLLERRCAGEEARYRGCELWPGWELTRWQVIWSQFQFWPSAWVSNSALAGTPRGSDQ